ncbi:hypothetical protein [Croceitalea vernalis]|uniref:Lipocalin-like domain-containing protein n=1 Tax=Croceitalea vernalis TaxID=3075599 RepID=A0ABU3BF74_9FLAO|nr:hypothetical protein [Croceitalea sp. P007]MDT0620822.1 hypothetical protein [Croceitalea sp. P007]
MTQSCLTIVAFIMFMGFCFGQDELNESFLDGCWSTYSFFGNGVSSKLTRCELGNGNVVVNFNKNGTYWMRSKNINRPQRCGNYLVKKINVSGNYKLNVESKTLFLYNTKGKLIHSWSLDSTFDN